MQKIIRKVLDRHKDSQINMSTESARESLSIEISESLKLNGEYKKYRIVDDAGVDVESGKATFPGLDVILKETDKLSEQISDTRPDGDGTEWIYESSDGGKTITKREIGSDKRIVVKSNER